MIAMTMLAMMVMRFLPLTGSHPSLQSTQGVHHVKRESPPSPLHLPLSLSRASISSRLASFVMGAARACFCSCSPDLCLRDQSKDHENCLFVGSLPNVPAACYSVSQGRDHERNVFGHFLPTDNIILHLINALSATQFVLQLTARNINFNTRQLSN